jgi:hypothetical protein
MMLLHLQVDLSLHVIMKYASQVSERTPPKKKEKEKEISTPFEGGDFEHVHTSWPAPISLEGKPLCSHMIGYKILVHRIPIL